MEIQYDRVLRVFFAGGGQWGGLPWFVWPGQQRLCPERRYRRPAVEIQHRQQRVFFAGGGQRGGVRRFGRRQRLCPERRYRCPAGKYATGDVVDSSPAVANGVVYVGSADHDVYALNAGTGALLWKYTTGSSLTGSPAVANGVVYVGSWDDNVYAL